MISGTVIQTEVRNILNQGKSQGISETKNQIAFKLLRRGKLTIEEIAEDTGLSAAEVGQLARLQMV